MEYRKYTEKSRQLIYLNRQSSNKLNYVSFTCRSLSMNDNERNERLSYEPNN